MTSSSNGRVTQGLPREARDAINAVFDALSAWREEVAASTERYSEKVLEKTSSAARALGWPMEFVDAFRMHLTQASKSQLQMIDQLMDAWQKQMTSPASEQFMAQLRSFPTLGFESRPAAVTPIEFWLQAAEMWQRNWASALSVWGGASSGTSRTH